MNKISKSLLVCITTVLGLTSMPVGASHLFSTNIEIEGIDVAAGNAFTNPTITVASGDSIDFSFDLFSSSSFTDTFNVYFSGVPFLANTSFAYNGSGTLVSPLNFLYSQIAGAPGTYSGTLTPDFSTSFPDYLFPGGSQVSEPTIPFKLVVTSSVPEPATLGLLGLGLMGMRVMRRKNPRNA